MLYTKNLTGSGTVGTDTVYLFNIATADDVTTFRVNNDLIITDKTDALDDHAESGGVLPNWYDSNSNTIEAFIVGNGASLSCDLMAVSVMRTYIAARCTNLCFSKIPPAKNKLCFFTSFHFH